MRQAEGPRGFASVRLVRPLPQAEHELRQGMLVNLPTLDEAVERGAKALRDGENTALREMDERGDTPQIASQAMARLVLLAAGWEDLRAEVERLRGELAEEEDTATALVSSTAETALGWRDLCDKLAEALEHVGHLLSVTDWDNPDTLPFDAPLYERWWKREVQPALTLYRERK